MRTARSTWQHAFIIHWQSACDCRLWCFVICCSHLADVRAHYVEFLKRYCDGGRQQEQLVVLVVRGARLFVALPHSCSSWFALTGFCSLWCLFARPDNKQGVLETFQSKFNMIPEDMRFEEATKAELHQRITEMLEELQVRRVDGCAWWQRVVTGVVIDVCVVALARGWLCCRPS